MLEIRSRQGRLMKKVIESMTDLVSDAILDCSATDISLKSLDTGHQALVYFRILSKAFDYYRCDRNFSMRIKLTYLAKILKCAGKKDIVTITAEDGADRITFNFESPSLDKIADFEMKRLYLSTDERMRIQDSQYQAVVRMPSAKFARICKDLKDLNTIGDAVAIAVASEGVMFSIMNENGTAHMFWEHQPKNATTIETKVFAYWLTYSMKYIHAFTKAAPLAEHVNIWLSSKVLIEYRLGKVGFVRYYLGSKKEETIPRPPTPPKPETKPKVEARHPPKAETKPKAKTMLPQPKPETETGMEDID